MERAFRLRCGKVARMRPVRTAMSLILFIVSGLLTLFLVSWAVYQTSHVVSYDASVQGVVAHVGARIDGQVVSVESSIGVRVKKGEVIARLEDTELLARLQRAHPVHRSCAAVARCAPLRPEVPVDEFGTRRQP